MIVKIKNPSVNNGVQTELSSDYSSGTTLYVESTTGFSANQYILIGEPNLEKTEIAKINSIVSATQLTITSLSFSHARGTPVYYILWDKYELQYKTTSSGNWNTYSGMPASLNYDALYTEYVDSSATSSYQWRYRYYSTEKDTYSDYSNTISAGGWSKNSVGYMIGKIRKTINDPESKTISDAEIIRYLNAAQQKVYSLYDRWWFLFVVGEPILTQSSVKKYNLPPDFGRMHTVLFNYVSGSTDITYNLKYLSMVEFDYVSADNTAENDDALKYYTIYPGDSNNESGYLYVYPTPDTNGLEIVPRYYKVIPDLDNYGDETVIPIPEMLENYAISRVLAIREEDSRATNYDKLFREQIELLKLMQRKQTGSMRYIWKYQGKDAEDRYFGKMPLNIDQIRENYF